MQSTENEIWKPVVGYEAAYEVSNLGRVRSIDRTIPDGRHWKGRVLRPGVRKDGRRYVTLAWDGKNTTRRIYLLVLEAFVGPRPEGMEGCHDNGNPADDQISNLRWDTPGKNRIDSVTHGTHANARKLTCKQGHELIEPNLQPKQLAEHGLRKCLTCSRARNWARSHGVPFTAEIAVRIHAEVLRAA